MSIAKRKNGLSHQKRKNPCSKVLRPAEERDPIRELSRDPMLSVFVSVRILEYSPFIGSSTSSFCLYLSLIRPFLSSIDGCHDTAYTNKQMVENGFPVVFHRGFILAHFHIVLVLNKKWHVVRTGQTIAYGFRRGWTLNVERWTFDRRLNFEPIVEFNFIRRITMIRIVLGCRIIIGFMCKKKCCSFFSSTLKTSQQVQNS